MRCVYLDGGGEPLCKASSPEYQLERDEVERFCRTERYQGCPLYREKELRFCNEGSGQRRIFP